MFLRCWDWVDCNWITTGCNLLKLVDVSVLVKISSQSLDNDAA